MAEIPEDFNITVKANPSKDTIRKGVMRLMRNDERCRNDDKWLIFRYIKDIQNIKIFMPFAQFENMVSFESVRRIRQTIQNTEGKLLPTDPEVRIARMINEQAWLDWLGKAKAHWGLEQ